MKKLSAEPARVFEIFEQICKIPHSSGNMNAISDFCVDFAKKNNLRFVKDDALNVIIYKEAAIGYKDSEPIILQGHLDMVCQKSDDKNIDFEKVPIEPYIEGDYVKANGTTLGADNGIAIAMIMAILENDNIAHPPIEAVFTTDEEVGMIGAGKIDMSLLKSKRMINLDAEDDDEVTVSCAGGCDVTLCIDCEKKKKKGTKAVITIKGLLGGHSGVEIDKGRVNANILMGRILNNTIQNMEFDIISISGGNKVNAIPVTCRAEILVDDYEAFSNYIGKYIDIVKGEIFDRENEAVISVERVGEGCFDVFKDVYTKKIVYMLVMSPNGIVDMSKKIDGLVETSLNLGILSTKENEVVIKYALRSNKQSALDFLKEKLFAQAKFLDIQCESDGAYSPWEYKENSSLRELYIETYKENTGATPRIVAIHAGLECAVFAEKIHNLDCIAIGPTMHAVHTTKERLSVSSTNTVFDILCRFLEKCK